MDAHWVNGRAGYRCRHGRTTANPGSAGRPKRLYVREDQVLASATVQLGVLCVSADPREIADSLRARGMDITCTRDTYIVGEYAKPP